LPQGGKLKIHFAQFAFYALSAIALLLIFLACWRVLERPGLRIGLSQTASGPQVTEVWRGGAGEQYGLRTGDRLLAIDGKSLSHVESVHFYVEQRRIGDELLVTLQRESSIMSLAFVLRSEYGAMEFWTTALAAFFFWFIGLLVMIKGTGDGARVFFLGTQAVAFAIAAVWPGPPFEGAPLQLGLAAPYAYLMIYPLVPPLLLHLAARFPQSHPVFGRAPWPMLFYVPAVALSMIMIEKYRIAFTTMKESDYLAFDRSYMFFRVFIIVMFVLAVSLFFISYRRAGKSSTAAARQARDQLRWIFWGLSIGAFPFFFLYTLPIIFAKPPIFSDALTAFFLLLIPISFAISIIRHQALDVNLVINRSLVYFSSTAGVIALYLGLVGFSSATLHSYFELSSTTISIFATLIAAAAFGPLRNKMQKIVDRTFFRIRYDYRQALGRFRAAIADVVDPQRIVEILLNEAEATIGIQRLAIIAFPPQRELQRYSLLTFEYPDEIVNSIQTSIAASPRPHVKAPLRESFAACGILSAPPGQEGALPLLALPLLGKKKLCGVLLCGRKKSGAYYVSEDLELLFAMCGYAALEIENIWLAQEMVLVQAEKDKLAALNELKNTFVSHLSHELRSPLTAIKWSLENLQDGMAGEPSIKARQYYGHLLESSDHLLRMIGNLLNVAHIESGEVPLHLQPVDLLAHIQSVVTIFEPLAAEKKVRIALDSAGFGGTSASVRLSAHAEVSVEPLSRAESSVTVLADHDALREILQNLLDNAIKHTAAGTTVTLCVKRMEDGRHAQVTVADNGAGVAPENLPHVFERFGKFSEKKKSPGRGLGLGLSIVKNLVERQGGQISVESAPGAGSRFIFTVPLATAAEGRPSEAAAVAATGTHTYA
jgi:signal transduction histidine kinase